MVGRQRQRRNRCRQARIESEAKHSWRRVSARRAEALAVDLADDIGVLSQWMQDEVLALAGGASSGT